MPKGDRPFERNPEARARLLAANIVYLDLGGLLPSKRKRVSAIIESLRGRKRPAAGDWIEIPERETAILIEQGSVDLVMPCGTGSIPVKRLRVGAVFGNVPSLGLTLAGAKAIAAEDCQVLMIDQEPLRNIRMKSPAISRRTVDELSRRVLEMEAERAGDIDARLMRLLRRIAGEPGVLDGVTSRDLAWVLGVTRQTVSEALGRLKAKGLIESSRMRIRVIDEPE